MSAVHYDRDPEGIVTLTFDDPEASVNTMNEAFVAGMTAAVGRLQQEREEGTLTGVVLASAKRTFFAGGDLKAIIRVGPDEAEEFFGEVERIKALLRRTETLGVPVVAAINGSALGGGLELALAAHRRIAVDDDRIELTLPEVTLGLLPGGGGLTRLVRLLGLLPALLDWTTTGTRHTPSGAKERGVVDELVATADDLIPAAKAWILEHRADDAAQPWDRPGYRMPGGGLGDEPLRSMLPSLPAVLAQQTKGADMPAPRAILAAAVEGAEVDFETATRIESRYFVSLVTGQTSKNMIQALFLDMQAIKSGAERPDGIEPTTVSRLAVLGAGMMGAGIAHAAARVGIDVVLLDISAEQAEAGKEHARSLLDKAVSRGRLDRTQRDEILGRIQATAEVADLAGCDAVIEAVFEDPDVKREMFAKVQRVVDPEALLGTNTSTLPITELARGVDRPDDFIGVHFFSPVDKMPIVELITGKQTSERALARAIDLVTRLRKTPIVVNDSRGFYTSRVIGTRVNEGLAMLAEGVHPMSIERAALQAGYPVGILQLTDELNMELLERIHRADVAAAARDGAELRTHPGTAVVTRMLELGRPGRLRGAGFYEYDDGKRTGLWPSLAEEFPPASAQPPLEDLKDRLLFAEALETARCFDEGVLTSTAAANVGSILAIGYPVTTGGTAQFLRSYPGGPAAVVTRARELATAYGARFEPPASLAGKAERGEEFSVS